MFVPIIIDGVQYRLRYPTKIQLDIEDNAGEFIFGNKDRKFTLFDLLANVMLAKVQTYLLWKGLEWDKPGITFDEVCELRDKYLSSEDPDGGDRYVKLGEIIADAVLMAYGMDRKKLEKSMKTKASRGTGQ